MHDTDRLDALEHDLAHLKAELARLSLLVAELSRGSDARRQSTQAAIDNLQQSVDLIFTHVHVPNVVFKPGVRHVIK